MLGIMGSGFRLSNHSSVGQGRILLIGPSHGGVNLNVENSGIFKVFIAFLLVFDGFLVFHLPGTRNSLEKTRHGLFFVMDEWVIFLWYPCHVYVCAFMYSLYSTLQIPCEYTHIPSVLPFWPLPSAWDNNFLGAAGVASRSSKRRVFALINRCGMRNS